MSQSIAEEYASRQAAAEKSREQFHKLWSQFGNFRLVAAIVTIIGLWQEWQDSGAIWQIMIVFGGFAFLGLALQQRQMGLRRDLFASMEEVNRRSLARFNHDWDEVSLPPDTEVSPEHPYARDLNIVGRASIAQRTGTPVTEHGWNALYKALLTDQELSNLPERQMAILELSSELDLRQNVEAVGTSNEGVPHSQPLVEWASGTDWLRPRLWMRWLGIIGPILVLAAIVLVAVTDLPWGIVLLPMLFNLVIFSLLARPAADAVQSVVPMREAVGSSRRIMALMARKPANSAYLRELDANLDGAAQAMGRLGSIVNFSIPPGSMLYFPLQMLLMWDVNVLNRLEAWRGEHGDQVAAWLDAMGEWESLAALSVLTHDHPDWAMADIKPDAEHLLAKHMAHPLLAENIAVANDVAIGPRGRFLFVTGSNMSGKSTLLRAIGTNAVLAQAGASVCAQTFVIPPLRIASCMRVEDSLAHGVSFFMAELLRLKSVIDLIEQDDDRMALFLLDEILQGTNTAERQIASRHILQLLGGMNAIGAVSSHDLELIEGTDLEQIAIPAHFAEQFTRVNGEPDMTFDYQLRPGIATSSNAIRLMELIGFQIHE